MKIVDINNKLYIVSETKYKELKAIRKEYINNIGKDSERSAYLKYIEYFNTFVKENKGSFPNTIITDVRINNK
jgi:GTP-sensing pleiotropic transcriptional regulator CodY